MNILERLRSRSPYLDGSSAERTMEEAADEIDRLRAALEMIRDDTRDDWAKNVARRALELKP